MKGLAYVISSCSLSLSLSLSVCAALRAIGYRERQRETERGDVIGRDRERREGIG